jgi:UPF0716 protein FxsA
MPIIEIGVLIKVGGWLGLWPTLALIILTAIAGTWMLRQQGFAVLSRAQSQLERGAIPLAEVFEGLCLVVAGVLLLTPGFVTDLMGGALLLPPVRALLYRVLGHHLRASVSVGQTGFNRGPSGNGPGGHGPGGPRRDGKGPVVEGDFETVTPENDGSDAKTGKAEEDKSMPPPRGGWNGKE